MNKVVDIKKAVDKIKSGDRIMVGGFGNVGCPMNLLYELSSRKEINHLTTISEDFQMGGLDGWYQGFTEMLMEDRIDEIIVSFFGHTEGNKKVAAGEVKLTLVPQGTLAERIRAAGSGVGGFYTPTGVGTIVEEGKETKIINGRKYILELPLHANVAIVKCHTADTMGNAVFAYTAQNFNTCMAMAADLVILECEHLVQPGEIAPDAVQLPGVFVDYVVHSEEVHY